MFVAFNTEDEWQLQIPIDHRCVVTVSDSTGWPRPRRLFGPFKLRTDLNPVFSFRSPTVVVGKRDWTFESLLRRFFRRLNGKPTRFLSGRRAGGRTGDMSRPVPGFKSEEMQSEVAASRHLAAARI